MWDWLNRKKSAAQPVLEPVLKGAPAKLRVKTYSAETGYVYQYVYRGYSALPDGTGREFVFRVTRDRKSYFEVKVVLLDEAIAECCRRLESDLLSAEHYAAAKMTLFRSFDAFEETRQFAENLIPTAAQMEEDLRVLGRF